ncbi:MAG: NADH:ubiquinone reductase (Na(+)-transporting) subunit F [Thermodesulfobacteriota bacterium]
MIYLVSTIVFCTVVLALVGVLLLLESKVVVKGERTIVINDDEEKKIRVPGNITLLSALLRNNILLPSACGGKGSCGTCKCRVEEGGRDVLPTELTHLSRKERLANIRIACQVKVKEDMKIRVPDEIFSIRKYQATVVSNKNVATFIKELVLKLEAGEKLNFEPGAYIQIDIPEYELSYEQFDVAEQYRAVWKKFNLWELHAVSSEPVNRAYSLANPPAEKDILKFTIRIATPPPGAGDIPPGIGSSYIFNLKPGDAVMLSGPYGEFFVKKTQREMCFIGGGAGMAPLRSQILHQLLALQTERKMTFWYGARSRQEMFYDDEFRGLAEKFKNFSYHVALSDPQPGDKWEGLTGFIHRSLYDNYLKDHEDPTEIEYYLCGPPPMLKAVKDTLFNLGVEPEMIAYDDFG